MARACQGTGNSPCLGSSWPCSGYGCSAVCGAQVQAWPVGRTGWHGRRNVIHICDGVCGISLLMLIGIVVTNAIVLLDLVQHRIEAGTDVRTALLPGGRTRVRPILMTAAATILALIPLALSSSGGLIAAGLATVGCGGPLRSTLLTLVGIPVIYSLLARPRGGGAGSGGLEAWAPPTGQATHDARPLEPVAVGREP